MDPNQFSLGQKCQVHFFFPTTGVISDSSPSAFQELRAARCPARGQHPNWENMPGSTTISILLVLAADRRANVLTVLLGCGASGLKSYRYVFFLNDAAQGDVDIGVRRLRGSGILTVSLHLILLEINSSDHSSYF